MAKQPRPVSLYEFGGDERTVREIQSRFIDFFRDSGPVLDIGCGRGIFLELLSAAGVQAMGVDHSQESLEFCRKKGLSVEQQDASDFLRDSSKRFGGIFCSHVIEHMTYDEAIAFLELCHNALRPGGTLLLLTPNPEDLAVISHIFWLDPTHVRPYPIPLLRMMLQTVGFQVKLEKRFLGHWRMIGRRNLVSYFLKRMVLGRNFGLPNILMLAKNG